MDIETIVTKLGHEWEQPHGFFGLLRQGVFDQGSFDRATAILAGVDITNEDSIDRRLVELIWFIPIFMVWQRERLQENGVNLHEYDEACHIMLNHVYAILGMP